MGGFLPLSSLGSSLTQLGLPFSLSSHPILPCVLHCNSAEVSGCTAEGTAVSAQAHKAVLARVLGAV